MKTKLLLFLFFAVDGLLILYLLLAHGTAISPGILAPAGPVAGQEKDLLTFSFLLAMIVILPVFGLFFFITTTYRDTKKQSYKPDWTPPTAIRLLWWIVPAIIVLIFAVRTWYDTHTLDPYRPLPSTAEPIRIQVVALDWKWLFIYPEENIATVNFIQFPVNTPVNFELTADAPMNSFWIPRLSGQIYAMTGMSTKLHILADTPGDYAGSAAEINGIGLSGMRFTARASTEEAYDAWVQSVQSSDTALNYQTYQQLAKPSTNNPVAVYRLTEPNLYNRIMNQFMPGMEGAQHETADTKDIDRSMQQMHH